MMSTRRQVLKAAAATMCFADQRLFAPLAALADETPERVTFGPELEPIVRLIEETPREEMVRTFVGELRRGMPYERLLAGSLFAGIRILRSNHEVYKIHSLQWVSRQARPEERLLPLFWGLNGYKQRQEDFPRPSMTAWRGKIPDARTAAEELDHALDTSDLERGEAAAIAMVRGLGAKRTIEQLWSRGARNGNTGGHMAISLANTSRALKTIGWRQAEPGVRFVIQDWIPFYAKPDRHYSGNLERAQKEWKSLPDGWDGDKADSSATRELFSLIRAGRADDVAAQVLTLLQHGTQAQALWDAVHLATAEFMVRMKDGWGLASRPLHSNTSTNAMHHAFRSAESRETRLLIVLQAASWAADKIGADTAAGSLRDLSLLDLPEEKSPKSLEAGVGEIFAQLPLRHYRWDQNQGAVLAYGSRDDADSACRKTLSLLKSRPEATRLFVQTAISWLCRKASNDTHEYKITAAMLEESDRVSKEWKPYLLAASVHYLHGPQSPDNTVVLQARDALKKS